MTSKSLEPCVICGEPIGVDSYGWDGGRNADPVAEGRCCEDCDNTIVLPARMIPHGYTTEEIIAEPNDGMPFQGFPR